MLISSYEAPLVFVRSAIVPVLAICRGEWENSAYPG